MKDMLSKCVLRGYFFHSAETVDTLWLDLREFEKAIRGHMKQVASHICEVLDSICQDSDVDTVLYVKSSEFGLDPAFDISTDLCERIEADWKHGNEKKEVRHCCVSKAELGFARQMHLIKFDHEFGYNAVVFFSTSFHLPAISRIIELLQDKRHIKIKGIIFLVCRVSDLEEKKDDHKNLIAKNLYSLYKINSHEAYFDDKYKEPISGEW